MKTDRMKLELDSVNYAAELHRQRVADCSWLLAQLVQRPELLEAVRNVDAEFAEDIRLGVKYANDSYSKLVATVIDRKLP
jgi:hypothetical protein